MGRILDGWSRLVTARPYILLLVLLLITAALASGTTRRAPPIERASVSYLPPGNAIADAMDEIDELFGESSDITVVTLILRGAALTPDGLSQMDTLLDDIVSDPSVTELLAPVDPVIAPAPFIGAALGVTSFESVTPSQIEQALSTPEINAAVAAMTGSDTDGEPVAIANIRLVDTGDEKVAEAERRINELAVGAGGPLRVSSVSPVIIEDEYREATETGIAQLLGLALLLIAALILLFLRTLTDLLLTLAGLIVSVTWVVGAEGWLGPGALGVIGPPTGLTSMVPIIVISLTVDYAIQTISHYREQRAEGGPVLEAIRTGLRHVTIPLVLAAVTTIVSMFAGLLSPIEAIGDFGILAGLGVGMSLIVMLTLVPAGRTIIDRRREARGTLKEPRPVSGALPGVERAAHLLGASVARRPLPYIVAVVGVTVGFGFAATGIKSEFSVRDILPDGGGVLNDLETLETAVGGFTEMASVLVRAEATDIRTLLNMQDLTTAFEDERRRPRTAAGPLSAPLLSLVLDWADESGEPGDNYDPDLAELLQAASGGVHLDSELMQEFLDKLEQRDPAVAHSLVNDPGGIDTMLMQFPFFTDDPSRTRLIQEELEGLWPLGEGEDITATSLAIVEVAVEDEITSRQLEAIVTTIVVALSILTIFFWVTLRQPALAFIAVGPIVLVLIWVLGTMALLDIPYSLITSIITALSIGIGVDYSIHVIHRYREEFYRVRNPEKAAIQTLTTTGSALLGSALTTVLGFGVLVFSSLLGFRQFAITTAVMIGYSLIVSILLVPPAMTVWGAYQNMRLRSTMQRMWDEIDVVADAMDGRHAREQSG